MNTALSMKTLLHSPNEPIFLDQIRVSHINGSALRRPFHAKIFLHFFPEISCRIESTDLPRDLIKLQNDAFSITTDYGCKAKVVLQYNLNELIRSSNCLTGYLHPVESPSAVLSTGTRIHSVSFGILNFPPFYGKNDKWKQIDGGSSRLGSTVIHFDQYRMRITENDDFSKNRKLLRQQNGFAITHTGQLQRVDGGNIPVMVVDDILRSVRAFFSFCRGAACGLTLVNATLASGEERLMQWGTTHTEPWLCGAPSWMPRLEGGDILGQLFPKFYDLCRNSNWKATSSTVIDWYLNANLSPFHVGIILAQAALESLSSRIYGQNIGSAHQRIAQAISDIGIGNQVPNACGELSRWIARLQSNGIVKIASGPHAITAIRNDLVHSNKRYGHIPWEAQVDALSLAQWYTEVMLLYQLGHVGPYKNRISPSVPGRTDSFPPGTTYIRP